MKKRINLYSALLAVIMVLASCSKPPQDLTDVKSDVNPSPLVVKAGKINAQINLTFPAKFIPKKAVVELIPVLSYGGGEVEGKSVTVQGEKVEDNNTSISYANGGGIAIPVSFDFQKEMRLSELQVKAKITIGSKEYTTPAYKVADGVNAIETLVNDRQAEPALGEDAFQRVIPDMAKADIHYIIQQANIRNSQLRDEDIKALKEFIKEAQAAENKEFAGVDVSSYASPDGPEDLNKRLAERRESNADKYIKGVLKRDKVDASKDGFIDSKFTPEDWEGFKELLEASSVDDKDLILRVLSMYSDPEVREKEIKNLSAAYKELAEDILPQLRRSRFTVNVNVIGKSDEEIAELAASNPSELNVEELLYAATLTDDNAKKLDIYKKVTSVYPKDWRGYNDMGCVLFETMKFDEAEKAFSKAAEADATSPEVQNNLGAIALVNGDVAKAKEYFGKAAGAGDELTYNLGLVNIHEGNYAAAVKNLGNSATNNAALAKILTEDYKGALATLNSVENPICMTDYLKAIVGAKTNDKTLVMSSLKAGVEKNEALKKMAVTELTFAEYFEDPEFKSIVE
ncbi:tetratricopeptide repeat protein [Saccharicrinis sp. FJH62]|uniref:tetratricopeptide repeat protein n=1 Tax=Saccharicrinis sp. FJH62 TaxID=3344657 RepID=UPI0035D43AA1